MKALVIAREGRKAILLLPGGEMRTVRARKDWRTGMEVPVKAAFAPVRRKRRRMNMRAALFPAAVCAAVCLMAFVGVNRLGGDYIDRQHPVTPLSSGLPASAQMPEETPAETASHAPVIAPTGTPDSAEPEIQSTPTSTPTPAPMPMPTPIQAVRPGETDAGQEKRCDECGEYGHDDDDCPNEQCDECGQYGHDDDDCPNEKCDECGGYGHDDDNCPYDRDDD